MNNEKENKLRDLYHRQVDSETLLPFSVSRELIQPLEQRSYTYEEILHFLSYPEDSLQT